MTTEETGDDDDKRRRGRRFRRGCGGCGCGCLAIPAILAVVVFLILQRVPLTYPAVDHPIPPPDAHRQLGAGLDGFESPYIGHTGSWDGKGGGMGGSSKRDDMDAERAMGLRWTFMPIYWRALEPDGPADLAHSVPPSWKELDDFVIAAHQRGLNVLMQAPVVGGNAGGPPDWAGRRETGKSAPKNMQALVDFAGKLALRYRPGGTLAVREGWGAHYGVRAWELDNEPANYFTSWDGQAADYAEFVTKAARRIRRQDPRAVIATPALACGGAQYTWLEESIEASRIAGSPNFRRQGTRYSIGPPTDVVSFHIYEGLDTGFSGRDRTIERAFGEVRAVFERHEKQPSGLGYPPKQEYWHTEGNYDFLGVLSEERRAAWRFQFFTRAFAAGIRKVVVMDASRKEQIAVRTYVQSLPDPFPMLRASDKIKVLRGRAEAFRHPDRTGKPGGQVWVIWAPAGTGTADVEIPVAHDHVETLSVDGQKEIVPASGHRVRVHLSGDDKMPRPVLIIDRATRN
jgi:hypothetical protein